jgi:type I restriction enzyme S subunit
MQSMQHSINASAVNALATAAPNHDEQDLLVATLDSAYAKIDLAVQKHRVFQDIFRTLLHELMSAKTHVRKINSAIAA